MKELKELIISDKVYEGIVFKAQTRKTIYNNPVTVYYERNCECVEVKDNLVYDLETGEFLELINDISEFSRLKNRDGLYFNPHTTIENSKVSYTFIIDEDSISYSHKEEKKSFINIFKKRVRK